MVTRTTDLVKFVIEDLELFGFIIPEGDGGVLNISSRLGGCLLFAGFPMDKRSVLVDNSESACGVIVVVPA